MATKSKVVNSSSLPDNIWIKHCLMFIFADVYSNFVRDFESECAKYKVQFRHELKKEFNSYKDYMYKARKAIERFLSYNITQNHDQIVDETFSDSDTFDILFKTIIDRVVGEQSNHDVLNRIYSYTHTHFRSSNLFPELNSEVSINKKFQLGLCCDMVNSCPIARSNIKDKNGYSYMQWYCHGMFKNCARRAIWVKHGAKAVPKNLLPDNTEYDG